MASLAACEEPRTHYVRVIDDIRWQQQAPSCDDGESPSIRWLGEQPDALYVADLTDTDINLAPGYTAAIELGFVNNAIAMDIKGETRESLAIIYRRVEEMMRESMLDDLDDEIASVPAEEIGTDVLLGLLTATLPVKRRLPSRPQLFRSTLKLLKTRGHFEPGVLDGLE